MTSSVYNDFYRPETIKLPLHITFYIKHATCAIGGKTTSNSVTFTRSAVRPIAERNAMSQVNSQIKKFMELFKGEFKALDNNGALILSHNGEERSITAGDIFL